MRVFLELITAQADEMHIMYTCPLCCSGTEGIHSKIEGELRERFISGILSSAGVRTQCPNCNTNLILVLEDDLKAKLVQGLADHI